MYLIHNPHLRLLEFVITHEFSMTKAHDNQRMIAERVPSLNYLKELEFFIVIKT